MGQKRKWSAAAKFKIALRTFKGNTTLTDLCKRYEVSQSLVHAWKKQLLEQGSQLFEKQEKPVISAARRKEQIRHQLQEQVANLIKERNFLARQIKKNSQIDRHRLIDVNSVKVSLRRQCELLGLNRSTLYYDKKPSALDVNDLLKAIRDIWEKNPTYGYRRVTRELRDKGMVVNHKRVQRLMGLSNMQAIYSGPNADKQKQLQKIHKYLLQE